MKYIILILVVAILSGVIYKYFFARDLPVAFKNVVNEQPDHFCVSKDSAEIVWNRASEYLYKMQHLIYGGPMEKNDSLIHIPYIQGLSYDRGNSVSIRKKNLNDSALFSVEWFFYDRPDTFSAKELVYFMRTGISRYDWK